MRRARLASSSRKRDGESTGATADVAEPVAGKRSTWRTRLLEEKRGDYLRDYLRWLAPHRKRLMAVCVLALLSAGAQSVEPLFMRYIVDRVLLANLPIADKVFRLNTAGAAFLLLVLLSALITVAKDYTQRILNVKVILALRRAIFDRFMHLPLPTLWNMKTGGLLSRLSGDVETTSGLLQMAIISPSISVVKLLMAMGVLVSLNWRLALTALAVIPGAMFMSFTFARRIRPIYRVVRQDAEQIDGRVGEAFSGIRVVRAFRQETRELLAYMQGRHTVLRKELFASRRELVLWTSWGLLIAIVNVVIVWYGGHLALRGNASVGDIFAFQWYVPADGTGVEHRELLQRDATHSRPWSGCSRCWRKPDKPDAPDAVLAPGPSTRSVSIRVLCLPRRQVRAARSRSHHSRRHGGRWSDAAVRQDHDHRSRGAFP